MNRSTFAIFRTLFFFLTAFETFAIMQRPVSWALLESFGVLYIIYFVAKAAALIWCHFEDHHPHKKPNRQRSLKNK